MISTLPVNVIDIAPILILISARTESGPVDSSTLPPSTHGTTRSRSRIVAKLSSIGFVVVNEWSSSTAMVGSPHEITVRTRRNIGSSHGARSRHAHVRSRKRHADGAHAADGRRREGRAQPRDRGHRLAGDRRGRRRRREPDDRADGRRGLAARARRERRHAGARRRRQGEHRADDRRRRAARAADRVPLDVRARWPTTASSRCRAT